MRSEDKKYVWWGLLGIGVAALFYFLSSSKQSSGGANTVNVPYLVPQTTTGASPTADTSLSDQSNIIGSSSNSTIPNFSNPAGVATSVGEAPNTWGFWPNLNVSSPTGPNNSVSSGWFHDWNWFHGGAIQQAPSPTHTQISQATGSPITITSGGMVTQ